MRLIDADKLIKDIESSNLEFIWDGKVLEFILKTIDNQPIISETVETKI